VLNCGFAGFTNLNQYFSRFLFIEDLDITPVTDRA
jgi:hypothetical protein